MFDIPRQPPLSIGQFQHAGVSPTFTEPTYAIGNSIKPPWMPGEHILTARSNEVRPANRANSRAVQYTSDRAHIDASFYLNDTLWDGFFFSTVPVPNLPTQYFFSGVSFNQDYIDEGDALPNARMHYFDPDGGTPEVADLQHPDRAAAHLMLDGAFNVNSTSVEAWMAQLAGLAERTYPAVNHTDEVTTADATLSRLGFPNTDYDASIDGSGGFDKFRRWNHPRNLTPGELRDLAEAIVEQIRIRGPFLSLSSFINRNLVAAANDPEDTRLMGALQAAIEHARLNDEFMQGDMLADESHAPDDLPDSYARGAPGFITQADLLTYLGPVLTARGDTFRMRVYGEVRNPLNPDEVRGRAWAEAIVQRTPEFVDPTNAPETSAYMRTGGGDGPMDGNFMFHAEPRIEINSDFSPVNRRFGRKFEVISFRWLSPEEV